MTKPRFSRLALHSSRHGAARKLMKNAPCPPEQTLGFIHSRRSRMTRSPFRRLVFGTLRELDDEAKRETLELPELDLR